MASTSPTTEDLEQNLQLIPFHEVSAASMVFLPVFVLFTRDSFGVSGALQIASLTYLFIVALEVPSGWMSDRIGRVPTMTAAAVGFVVGQVCFIVGGDTFGLIVLGQFFVSSGYAFLSGTDVSFHYDTLESLGRSDEYAARQARVSSVGYVMRAATAVLGGALGLISLRLPFIVALAFSLTQLAITRLLTEPDSQQHADPFLSQLGKCMRYLRDGFMGWLFFYGIAHVVLEHVAFTLMQPWLTEALGKQPEDLGATPLVSGMLLAVTAFVGAGAARSSAAVGARFGTVATLIGLGVLSSIIVSGMALSFSLLVVGLMIFRSVQGAAAPVLISAAVAPRTLQHHRATLLSVNSLAGRLVYGGLLQVLALDIADDPRPFLRTASVISWTLVAVLIPAGMWAAKREHSD